MKIISKILIYISIVFVIVYIYNNKDIELPNIISIENLLFSVLLLISGFLLQAKVWQNLLILKTNCKNCNFRFAFVSEYLSIFNKYIPGKIWTIVGPAVYVSNTKNISLKQTTYIATFFQILIIWSGVVISFIGIKGFLNEFEYLLLVFLSILITIIVFNRTLFNYFTKILKKFVNLDLEYFSPKYYLSSIFYLFLQWMAWGLGFVFLIESFYSINFNFDLLIIFPIAGTLGLLAVISPGGLGIREGVIVVLLMQYGLPIEQATIISILSRFWFLIGEVIVFLMALYLGKKNLKGIK